MKNPCKNYYFTKKSFEKFPNESSYETLYKIVEDFLMESSMNSQKIPEVFSEWKKRKNCKNSPEEIFEQKINLLGISESIRAKISSRN